MLGIFRIKSEIDYKKLMFLYKILCLPETCITKEIFIAKYVMYLTDKNSVSLGFIPDICQVLTKYNLTSLLNDYFCNNTLVDKLTWKRLVGTAIKTREQNLWEARVSANPEFAFFQVLQPEIEPSIVYKTSNRSSFRLIQNTVAKLWVQSIQFTNATCEKCSAHYLDATVHLLAECTATETVRAEFSRETRSTFGNTIADELDSLESFSWSLRIMGAALPLFLDRSIELEFLQACFKYIVRCIEMF